MTAPLPRTSRFPVYLAVGVLLGLVVWSYWTTLESVVWRWGADPQYSHGWLVPMFAGYLLWLRRGRLEGQNGGVNFLGLGLIAAALGLRLAGARFHFDYLDQISLLPCLAGIFFLVGSWPALFWSMPAVVFLAFMIPLPHSVSLAMSGPMQELATNVSTFALQVMGRPAIAEGNVILLNDIELGIVEACSGLRMLVVFFALSTGVAILIRKPLWEKLLLAGSAVPIALLSNVLRITITGLFYDALGNHFGGTFFHDLAGWLMMPLGLMFLGVEMWVLGKLLVDPAKRMAMAGPTVAAQGTRPLASLYQAPRSTRRAKAAPVVPQARRDEDQNAVNIEEPVAQISLASVEP